MIKAEVVKACTINNSPKKPGDSVEVDENTFNNLVRKGVLKAAGAKAVKIVDVPSLARDEQPQRPQPDPRVEKALQDIDKGKALDKLPEPKKPARRNASNSK